MKPIHDDVILNIFLGLAILQYFFTVLEVAKVNSIEFAYVHGVRATAVISFLTF